MNWLRSRFGVVPGCHKDNHSYFLGTQNTDIKVTDLYATANSETGSFGRLLGSYTGRGGAFKRGKMITFRAEGVRLFPMYASSCSLKVRILSGYFSTCIPY